MTEFTHLMTLAERQRLSSQVRLLLQQPQLSDHDDFEGVKTALKYSPAKAIRQKCRRKQAVPQASSLKCEENGLGLVCELVTAKGRDKLRAKSAGERVAVLIVSKGSDGAHHFSVSFIDSISKNLDVVLSDEAEVTIVGIQPVAFLNSLREMAESGAQVRDSNTPAQNSDVSSKRRPRSRVTRAVWNIRGMFTLKGFIVRVLTLMALYVGYDRLTYGWNKIDNMSHYYLGRMPPDLWSSPEIQATFELAKSLQSLTGLDLDGKTYQADFSRRKLVDAIWTAVSVDIPKMCLSAYVVVTLFVRGGTGPFYRTLCFEVIYLARDEYRLLASTQMVSVAFSKTTYAYFAEDMLREAARVFYLCLLCWKPADRTHRLRFLVRSLATSIFTSVLLTAVIWSPFLLKSNEPRVVNLEEYAKMYQPPELRPGDKRNIPFVTT